MKTAILRHNLLPTLALLLLPLCLLGADGSAARNHHFDSSVHNDVQMTLQLYKVMFGVELLIDSRAAQVKTPIVWPVKVSEGFTEDEARKLMEKTLLEQSGIVITHLDDKRVSVTYNDALPIKKAKP
jgi:hypothetical protein